MCPENGDSCRGILKEFLNRQIRVYNPKTVFPVVEHGTCFANEFSGLNALESPCHFALGGFVSTMHGVSVCADPPGSGYFAALKNQHGSLMILNPEEETHAKDAMYAKEGTYEKFSIHLGVTCFLSNPLRIFLPWRALRPLREIQLLFF